MNKIISIIFILLYLAPNLIAQHQFGVKADVGISMLEKKVDEIMEWDRVEKWGPSFNVGLLYNYVLAENVYFMAEAKYSLLTSKSSSILCGGCGSPVIDASINDISETDKLSYLVFPFSVGYRYKSFLIKGGFQYGIELKSEYTFEIQDASIPNEQIYKSTGEYDFNDDFGMLFGLMFFTSNRTAIELNYYRGINNLCDCPVVEYRNSQLTFGFRYLLIAGEKNTGE